MADILYDFVRVIYEVECCDCGAIDQKPRYGNSELEAAKEFEADGWEVIDGEAVCPACAKEGVKRND